MKVVLCIAGLSAGGGERQLVLLARGLVKAGHEVAVLVFNKAGTEHYSIDAHEDIKVTFAGLQKGEKGLIAAWKILLFLKKNITKEKPDIVYGTLFLADCAVRIGRLLGFIQCPVVTTIRTDYLKVYKSWQKIVEELFLQFRDALVTNHFPTAEFLSRKKQIRIVYIPNGVAPLTVDRKMHSEKGACVRFAVIGQLRFEWKRQDWIVEALYRCQQTFIGRFRCDFYGQGKDKDALERMIALNGLREYATVHRPVLDVAEVFAKCDALIHASTLEGCPNVVVEAMSCDVPVILSRYTAKIVVNDSNDIAIVAGADDTMSIKQGIVDFLNMTIEERRALGKRGGDYVRAKYAVNIMVKHHIQLFEEMLKIS